MAYGLSNSDVTDDVTWPWKVKLVTPIRLERNISKLETSNLVCCFVSGVPSGHTNNYPESGRGLSRDPYNIWHTIEHIFKTTWARDFKFDTRLCMGNAEQRINNFPESSRGLGHVTLAIFGSTVGYPSDSLASCLIYQAPFPNVLTSLC